MAVRLDINKLKKKIKNPDDIEWDPIIEISNITVPDFPIEIFPREIKSFIESTARFTQVAVDAVAMTCLFAFSSAVTNKFVITPKQGWSETLNLYILIAAAPSERKSPVFNIMIKPLYKALDKENVERSKEIIKQNTKIKLLKKQISENEDLNLSKLSAVDKERLSSELTALYIELDDLEANKMNSLELFASDITPEKVVYLMEKNGGPLAILSPEGAEIFDIMAGRYSNKTIVDIFLKGYSGDPVSQSRMNAEKSRRVDKPVLTMGLFVQPSVVKSLPENFLNRGLMQRFLYSYPKSLAGYRDINSPTIPENELKYYENHISNLLSFSIKEGRIELTFSEKAQLKYDEMRLEHEKVHLEEKYSDFFKQWVGKFDGNLARLIGLFHIMENLDDLNNMPHVVSEYTVERASLLKYYIMTNAEKTFGILEHSEISKGIEFILKKLKKDYANCTVITYQEMWQKTSKKFKKSDVLRNNLKYLEEMNYVKLIKDTNNRNKEMIYIHPELVNLVEG